MKWIEITIKTTTEAVDAVSDILYELGAGGVIIEDTNPMIDKELEDRWDYLDLPITDYDFEGAIVKGYLPEPEGGDYSGKVEEIQKAVNNLTHFNIDKGLGEVSALEVFEEDWATSWKQHYKPVKLSERLTIKPSWEDYTPVCDDEIVIELDPGMAFGTGTHETTAMTLQFIEKYLKPGMDVIDVGCGSGILSIGAALMGAGTVTAIDLDPIAVKVAKQNVEINKVNVEVVEGDLLKNINKKADLIVANIFADIIIDLSPYLSTALKDNGYFICSGVIKEREDDVKRALKTLCFKDIDIMEANEWIAMVFKKG